MESPEKIPLEEALARGLIACSSCGAKGPDVKRSGSGFACPACAAKSGRRSGIWLAALVGLLVALWIGGQIRPGPEPVPDPILAEAEALLEAKRFAEVRDKMTARIAAAPGDPGAHLYLGHALYNLHHVEDALAEFRKVGELDPESASLGEVWIGICLQRLGYAAEALPLLQKPSRGRLDERRLVGLAEALLDLERYDEALALLPPTSTDARSVFNRHRGLRYGGKTAEADALVASLDPATAWTFRMTVLREAGDFDGARALIEKHKATTDGFRIARAELHLALEEGNLTRLLEPYVEAGDGLWFRAVALLLMGDREQAVKTAREFLAKTDPKLVTLRANRLTMSVLAGKTSVAELDAEIARVHRFQAPDYQYFLALVTGDKARAVKGLEGTPGHNFPYHALKRLAGR